MTILVTIPRRQNLTRFFTPALQERLEKTGEVRWNKTVLAPTPIELRQTLRDCDICVTGWETPQLDGAVLDVADRLKLLTHVGGSVASIASDALYACGVQVCSGNRVMARHVAEGILALMLASLRDLPHFDRALHTDAPWPRDPHRARSLLGQSVGFVGLGTVGRWLLDLLRPFDATVRVYDPYATAADLANWPHAQLAPLDEVLGESTVVSVHASLTEETIGLLGPAQLAQLRDGALLVNAARGAILDETALIAELTAGRIRAALDVFKKEPLTVDSPLRKLDNVLLSPHLAGATSHYAITAAMVDEIERFAAGRPLEHTVPQTQFQRMTRHDLAKGA